MTQRARLRVQVLDVDALHLVSVLDLHVRGIGARNAQHRVIAQALEAKEVVIRVSAESECCGGGITSFLGESVVAVTWPLDSLSLQTLSLWRGRRQSLETRPLSSGRDFSLDLMNAFQCTGLLSHCRTDSSMARLTCSSHMYVVEHDAKRTVVSVLVEPVHRAPALRAHCVLVLALHALHLLLRLEVVILGVLVQHILSDDLFFLLVNCQTPRTQCTT